MRNSPLVRGLLVLTLTCNPVVLAEASTNTTEARTAEVPVATATATVALDAAATEPGGEEQPEVIVTRDNGNLPPDCGPRAVAGLLLRFLNAWNHGDQAQLAELIADQSGVREESFQWYSVTEGDPSKEGRHFVTFRPEGVLEYASERYTQREQLQLLSVDVGAGGNFGFALLRQADDLQPDLEALAHGKGAIDCAAGRIRVWSMGIPAGGDPPVLPFGPCPEPAANIDTVAVVACTRA
jgi:hypothetical protein